MLPVEELQLKINDLRQAIEVEKQHRYIDLQGKKQRFSQYLVESLQLLSPFLEGESTFNPLREAATQYHFMDLSVRMRVVDGVAKLLEGIRLSATPQRPKTVMLHQYTETPSEIEVKFVKGIGPKVATLLNRANVYTIEDLLYYFPRKYWTIKIV